MIVTKRYEWDMAHRLPHHDGKCRRLHGHRYTAEIDVDGPVLIDGPSRGMVVDFKILKDLIEVTIGHWDHRCMLHREDNVVACLDDSIVWVTFIPTAENIAQEILRRLRDEHFLNVVRVRVYETPDGWAEARA